MAKNEDKDDMVTNEEIGEMEHIANNSEMQKR